MGYELPRAHPDNFIYRAILCVKEVHNSVAKNLLGAIGLDEKWPFNMVILNKGRDVSPRWQEPGIRDNCWCCYVCPSHKNQDPGGPLSEIFHWCPQVCENRERVI